MIRLIMGATVDWRTCPARPLFCVRILVAALVLSTGLPRNEMLAQKTTTAEQTAIAEGLQLLRGGQALQAKAKFDAAIKAAPRSADALTWRGICENLMAQYAAAAADFRSALRIDESMLPAHYNLALSLIRLREIDPAMEQLRIVIAAQPSAVQPRYNLAILLEGKGLFAKAIDELGVAHTLEPDDKGVTLHLLMDGLKVKGTPQAPLLIHDIVDTSTPPEIQREAGTALVEAERFSDASAILESARTREPEAHGINSMLARAYIGEQKNAEAVALLDAVPGGRKDEEEIYLLALAYTGAGNLHKAAENFEAAARLNPKDARPLYHLGLIAATSAQGQTKSAELLRSAIQLDPSKIDYSLALTRVLLVSDQAEEAKVVLSKLSPVGEEAAQIHALTGVAFAATHEIDKAIPQLKKAVEEEPTLALAHNVLGFCLFQQGRYAEAAEAYGSASRLEPKRLLYARDAALAYERANQAEQALAFAERANALGDADASDHVLLGKLYASSGYKQDAVRELRRAAELNPDLDSAYYLLARTYMQMGDRQQATEWSDKLSLLKQRHDAAVALQKKASPAAIRSSTLLEGGSLSSDDAGAP